MADTLNLDYEHPDRFVQRVDGMPFEHIHISQTMAELQQGDPSSGAQGLSVDFVRSYFTDLKQRWKALTAQQHMLEALGSKEAFAKRTDLDNVMKLKTETEAQAANLKRLTAGRDDLQRHLSEAITELAEVWHGYLAARESYQRAAEVQPKGGKRRVNVGKLRERNAATNEMGKVSDELLLLDSEQRCNAVLDAQEAVAVKIESEVAAYELRCKESEAAQVTLEDAIAGHKGTLQRLEAERVRQEPAVKGIEEARDWYRNVSKLMSALGGFNVELSGMSSHMLRVRFRELPMPCGGYSPEGLLSVRFNGDDTRFESAELVVPRDAAAGLAAAAAAVHHQATSSASASGYGGSKMSDQGDGVDAVEGSQYVAVDISDLVEYAVELQDLALLVREAQRRVLE